MNIDLAQLARLIRYYILTSTTAAGSGHPTSSLSATDLMTVLLFGGFFHANLNDQNFENNDRMIFSKGHAAPLLYALYTVAGKITESELQSLRQFDSALEGHPTMRFPFTEAATGSLGQGLSIGVGMALNAKYLDHLPYRTYVLLGDSEMAEGSNWEAIQLAAHYQLNNLIGIIDVNRLGQRGETMEGYDLDSYRGKLAAFGWNPIEVDGHDLSAITTAFAQAQQATQPTILLARTVKGKGVSFLENKDGWHGKSLSQEQLSAALEELGNVDTSLRGTVAKPEAISQTNHQNSYNTHSRELATGDSRNVATPISQALISPQNNMLATRKAYGSAITELGNENKDIVVLDAEVSNSTYAEIFKQVYPGRFFEMFIAEQNMIGVGVGLAQRGKIPFISSFAAFLTRAFDQIRMAQYSHANIKLVGSHAGVSIGEDGSSQMGLEDIAMMRVISNSIVLYPCDSVSTQKLVAEMYSHQGISYLRTTRMDTPVIYDESEEFLIGGSKTLRYSDHDQVTLVAAGITLHQALRAYEQLAKQNIRVRVIDLYSIKPIDKATLRKAARETDAIITIEDHYPQGGIGEAVRSALMTSSLSDNSFSMNDLSIPIYSLAVNKEPHSGTPEELLHYEEIDADAIVKQVQSVLL